MKFSRRAFLRGLVALPLVALLPDLAQAEDPEDNKVYLPMIFGNGECMLDPILAVTDGTERVDLLGFDSGFELDDPGWRPQVAQLKGGGSFASSQIAEGRRLVSGEYDDVVETIPLVIRAADQDKAIRTVRRLMQLLKQAQDYWTESSEYDDVWLEARPACSDCFTGYSRVVKGTIADIANPFGQPFFSAFESSQMDAINLVVEREPFWRALPPGEIIGPLYNLLKNPDFEQWNFGVADCQPDCWSDLETAGVTGQNSREDASPHSGRYSLKVRVNGSAAAGAAKGVTQVAEGTEDGQTYTLVGWVRSEGVLSGVGRILITSLLGSHEAWRSADRMGWTLVTHVFTAGVGDVVGVNCEILTTSAVPQTLGTVWFDSLMLLKGDWEQEAQDGVLPYMTSSHVVNHWDTGAGDLNYVDSWSIPGDVDSLVRLEVMNDTTPADPGAVVELVHDLRVGQRRTGDVFLFDCYHDPVGVADATGSDSDRITTPSLNTDWQDVTTKLVLGVVVVRSNEGRFRLLARVWDPSTPATIQVRLNYFLGSPEDGLKVLDGVSIPISGAWAMLDLTDNAAMIWDQKHSANPSGQLGYKLQLRRSSGTGVGRFDYVLALPTDGGYLHAVLTPPLTQGQALVADNTTSMQVSSTLVKHGWKGLFATNMWAVVDFRSFKGRIYLTALDTATSTGNVFRQGPAETTWTNVFNGAGYNVPATGFLHLPLEVYNGLLHCGGYNAAGARLWQTSDGATWSSVLTDADPIIIKLKSFYGRLYFATALTGWPGDTHIRYWDGAAVTTTRTLTTEEVFCFEEYAGKLYTAINGRVEVHDPVAGAWAVSKAAGVGFAARAMKAFKGKLYVSGSSRIWSFDGSAWVQEADLTTGYHPWPEMGYAMEELDEKLYLAGVHVGTTSSPLFVSEDGTTWGPTYDPGAQINRALYASQGVLYLGIYRGAGTGLTDVYRLALADVVSSVADYEMGGGEQGGFTAPNRRLSGDPRRHRWVLSYDREGFVNNINDKALVGIGYVPRYLALRGRD